MPARFQKDNAGFRRLAVDPRVAAVVAEIGAEVIAAGERIIAPHTKSGDYAASFSGEVTRVEVQTSYGSHPAAACVVRNTSDHAAAVEWGNARDHTALHVMGRAVAEVASK